MGSAYRVLGVPLIAGLSYEVIKWAGKNRRKRWVRAVMWPGMQLQLLTTREPAVLVLEDGRTFTGRSFGHRGETVGEAVFCTAMTGYQETLTDPSYHRQVVVATAPHIGNTGWNDEDDESGQIWVAGYVIRDAARVPSTRQPAPTAR